MQLRIRQAQIVSALLCAAAFAPMYAATPKATAYTATQVTVRKWDHQLQRCQATSITQGTSRERVRALLGAPVRTIGPDIAFYENCQPDQGVPVHCPILMVHFHGDRVALLQFVNESAAAAVTREPLILDKVQPIRG